MVLTAKTKVQLRLTATTKLSPSDALDVVRQAANTDKKGSGMNALNFNLLNMDAKVHIARETPDRLALSISSYNRRVELCTFSARVTGSNGTTRLQVGGLETYKTTQQKLFLLIPVGPKSIWGYPHYKQFLEIVAAALRERDASAQVSIDIPAAA